ncbi:EthD family reductase [Streptosporangium sp. NPDC000396]|uniref:EthD domain-containing protein n=1 Tax=Streptosporangium sp. NPDC000396 TaxID=3366185 RepID=UPI00368BAD8A
MIHQLIFASPRPGMTEEEFQRYWIEVHAVRYASKIPQIKRYCVDARVNSASDKGEPLWGGVAEIWLANDADQLASLQSPEFLQGARLDEPRWAAFWQTLVLDTEAAEVVPGEPQSADRPGTKLLMLVKRRAGLSLQEFRESSLGGFAELVREIPGLRRYWQGHVRDGAYAIGETALDCAHQLWFDSVADLDAALAGPEFGKAMADLETFIEPRYVHRLVVQENWIIGP